MIDSDGDGNADKYGLRGCVQTLNANDVLNVRSKISCWLNYCCILFKTSSPKISKMNV